MSKLTCKSRVLSKLNRYQRRGVSVKDFGVGFRLSARICELRADGHGIETDLSGEVAVYRLSSQIADI
jgi:hypothetical protein